MKNLNRIYLSIGSNMGNRYLNLQKAVLALNIKVGTVLQTSSIYENSAVGFDGGDFLKACVLLETTLSPTKVLAELKQIESNFGRKRDPNQGYASRSIDLDILYFHDLIINGAGLSIPHPRMIERNFVLKPLADIAPQVYHPVYKKDTRNLLQECKDKNKLNKTELHFYKNRTELFSQLQFLAIEGNIF